MRNARTVLLTFSAILAAAGVLLGQQIGDGPAIPVHMDQTAIEAGQISFQEIVKFGEQLFTAIFNKFDGQGRPATTADGKPRTTLQSGMIRTTGPDAHSCSSCHNRPRI